jgi:hypothetical protein
MGSTVFAVSDYEGMFEELVHIDNINIGDIVNVKVCGKKFTLYDKMISIIGKIIKDKNDDYDIKEVEEDDNLSIDEEEDSELDETNYDGIELFNEEDEEEDEFNTDKLKSNSKGGKKGGLDFDEDDDEEEEDEEEDDDDEGVDEEDIEGEDYGDDYDDPGGYIDD